MFIKTCALCCQDADYLSLSEGDDEGSLDVDKMVAGIPTGSALASRTDEIPAGSAVASSTAELPPLSASASDATDISAPR